MSIFDKIQEPIFLKKETSATKQLETLKALLPKVIDEQKKMLESDIYALQAGLEGEKSVEFELANSHIPMIILHDIHLAFKDLSAQIDYIIITRWHCFVIEAKHYQGNIKVDSSGVFSQTKNPGTKYWEKKDIYSPVTQSKRHMDLIKEIRYHNKSALTKMLFTDSFFRDYYKELIIFTNPRSHLDKKEAPKEIRPLLIRADQLIKTITEIDKDHRNLRNNDSDMEKQARYFLNQHKENTTDYSKKYSLKPEPLADYDYFK